MVVLSLFDGCACARVALERAGIEIEKYYASEIDKYAIQIAMKNYPDIIQLGDITKWENWDIQQPDLIIGGFPCQPYSVAGNRKGLEDDRGQPLLDAMFGTIKEYQPKDVLLENVQGLLSAQKGEAFKYIVKQLNDCGFAVDWKIINSALVSAQNRVRLYIICRRLDLCDNYTIGLGQKNKK